MLGRYALYEKVASGGMATVHIGRLLGPVGFARTVAIKRMHPQFAEDPEFVSMFLDEARLAARIRHPNVVPTLDVVATAGELFLVMDFIQGEALSRLIRAASARGERIPPEMVAAIMVGVLHGLHAAHEATSDHGVPLGIVHRDVSPHNVLVGTDGVARVLDFGVAKAAGRIQTTREGQLKGKLAYMAPEQVRGSVSRRTDVYAASVVLWEALTGKRLFVGENEGQMLDRILHGCDVPPSTHVPDLPRALDEVTMRGLSADPAERFPTAREMARSLEDAVPLATASRIGDWVEAAAKETLEERSARIASIESDSIVPAAPPLAAAPSLPTGMPRPRPTGARIEGPPIDGTDDMPTELSSGSVSSPSRTSPVKSWPRRTWLAAASGALVLVAASLVLLLSRHPTPTVPAALEPATQASALVAPQPSTSAWGAASTETAPAPPDGALSTAPTSSASASATAAASPPKGRPSPAVTTSTTSHCKPPWYFDRRGVRVFKPECL